MPTLLRHELDIGQNITNNEGNCSLAIYELTSVFNVPISARIGAVHMNMIFGILITTVIYSTTFSAPTCHSLSAKDGVMLGKHLINPFNLAFKGCLISRQDEIQ